jgi:hypothetical protein
MIYSGILLKLNILEEGKIYKLLKTYACCKQHKKRQQGEEAFLHTSLHGPNTYFIPPK